MTISVQSPGADLDPLDDGRPWVEEDGDDAPGDDLKSAAPLVLPGPLGIDVSAYQPNVDWEQVAAAGKRFAYIRFSYSRTADKRAAHHWQAAREAGLLCGGYHFFRNTTEVQRQLDAFLGVCGGAHGYGPVALPPVLDLEWDKYGSSLSSAQARADYVRKAIDWLESVRREVERPPIIYTGPSFWKEIGDPDGLNEFGLWVARPEASKPRLPAPWSQYMFWQYSHRGKVAGISGKVDLDVFRGTDAELDLLAAGSP